MLILKLILIGCAVMLSVFVLVFAPETYRFWREYLGPIYSRWWRIYGRRRAVSTLRGVGVCVSVIVLYWLFSFAA